MSTQDKKQHTRPCADCPFGKKVKPGFLGGSPPETYIGQATGPFLLPCHSTHDYTKDKCRRDPNNAQCAGAAIFRANVGVNDRLPPALLHLPVDRESVFGSYEEFYAHHHGIPLEDATRLMKEFTPDFFLELEMRRSGVQPVRITR